MGLVEPALLQGNFGLIAEVLLGKSDGIARAAFALRFPEELNQFHERMAEVYDNWVSFEHKYSKTEDSATVTLLLLGMVRYLLLSMNTLMLGNNALSGNAGRQCLECIGMAVLASRPEFGYLKRYKDGKFSTKDALTTLIRRHRDFGVEKSAVEILKRGAAHFNDFSHPSFLALMDSFPLGGERLVFLGPVFDEAKAPYVQRELQSRVGIAGILTSVLDAAANNMDCWYQRT